MKNKYIIRKETLDKIKDLIVNTDNKIVKLAGIEVDHISERHVKLRLPLGDVNVNHIGTAYAVSMVILMEVAGASVIRATYGLDTFVPIIKRMEVVYLKPTRKTLVCDINISKQQAETSISAVEERGKGNYELPVTLNDIEGEEIAKANFTFYLIPVNTDNIQDK